jgi:hypothetical protein
MNRGAGVPGSREDAHPIAPDHEKFLSDERGQVTVLCRALSSQTWGNFPTGASASSDVRNALTRRRAGRTVSSSCVESRSPSSYRSRLYS